MEVEKYNYFIHYYIDKLSLRVHLNIKFKYMKLILIMIL